MLLENMMEDKRLNFSRPLLSVRRHASTIVMEKDNKRNTRSSSSVPTIPRPPNYKSELKSGPVRNPGTVPFRWEQSPGRPKDDKTAETFEGPPVVPKLPPGRTLIANQQDNDYVSANVGSHRSQDNRNHGSQNVVHLDEYGGGTECSENITEKLEEEEAESEDEDEVFEDALDTLSRAESSFLNCSVSGISGLDDSDVKPSGTFLTDPQAKEFMMGRFLPVAKAMISETPQYAPTKKQSVVEGNSTPVKKVAKEVNRPQLRYGPSFAKHYAESQYTGEEEESDDEYVENENFHGKACGLLPTFCLKNSLCRLNPLPAMSVRTRVAMSPARRAPARSSSASTCSKTENELSSFDASEQRSIDGSQTAEVLEDKNDVANNEISSKSQKLESSVSVDQVALPAISAELEDGSFRLPGKVYRSFRDLLADDNISEEVDSGGPAAEKTLYIDSVHTGKSLEQKTCTFNSKELTNLGEDVDEVSMKMAKKTNLPENPSLVKQLNNVASGDVSKTDVQKTSQMIEKNAAKDFGEDEHLYQDAADSEILEGPVEKAAQSLKKQTPRAEKLDNYHGIYVEFPVPPPLPSSPSDSWLCRTLPAMSLKNSYRHHYNFGTGTNLRNQASSKAQSVDPKWETMVRATKGHHQHLRYSEELLTPIPES